MSIIPKYSLFTRIPFINNFKLLNEVLSNIINEVTWVLNAPDKNNSNSFGGLKIATANPNKTMYIKIELNLNEHYKLTEYFCKYDKLEIGIDLKGLFGILKSVGKEENLTMTILENNKNRLKITVDDVSIGKTHDFDLKLREPDQKDRPTTIKEFVYEIKMPNKEFHKICSKMASFSEFIEIKCTATKIIFTCKGDIIDSCCTYSSGVAGVFISVNPTINTPPIYQGVFDLKSITLFNKCSDLCDDIKLNLVNDFPINIHYEMSPGSSFKVLLSPISETNINNVSFNYNDDSDDDIDIIDNKVNHV